MPLAIDLFCGLGGWTDGLIAEGYDVVGYDIEEHAYGDMRYQGKLVLQDVCTIHGADFKDAALIVASPPCQEYSYMAMPWSLAKAKAAAIRADTTGEALAKLNRLFNECFRIQREASVAAGRHIPLVVENVRGAQPWVGRARANFGSFFFWGDVPALMPSAQGAIKKGIAHREGATNFHPELNNGRKVPGQNWNRFKETGEKSPHWRLEGIKGSEGYERDHPAAFGWKKPNTSSHSSARKAASAKIAMIPPEVSTWIGRCFKPTAHAAKL